MKRILLIIILYFNIVPYIKEGCISLQGGTSSMAQSDGSGEECEFGVGPVYAGEQDGKTYYHDCMIVTDCHDIIVDFRDCGPTYIEECLEVTTHTETYQDGTNADGCEVWITRTWEEWADGSGVVEDSESTSESFKNCPPPGGGGGEDGGQDPPPPPPSDPGTGGGGTGGGSQPPPSPPPPAPRQRGACNTFENRVNSILSHEGGFVSDPNDPGGATNRGIAWKTWVANAQSVLGKQPTLENLKNLTVDEAKQIYRALYWTPIRADEINDGDLRYLLFDFYVNAGGNAIKVLQRTLNDLGASLADDGGMGTQTINAINLANPLDLYNRYKVNRQSYYNDLVAKKPLLKKFLNGWTNRVNTFRNKIATDQVNVNCPYIP